MIITPHSALRHWWTPVGVQLQTRRFDQLREAGAYKDVAGAWTIPLAALLHVGLTPGRPTPPDAVPMTQEPGLGQLDVHRRVTELEEQVVNLRRRAEVAEALAGERAERITDLHRAPAVLEAAPQHRAPAVDRAGEAVPPAMPAPAARRGLLGRVGRMLASIVGM